MYQEGVRYSYDRGRYSYDRQAARGGWDDLERAAKRTMAKVSAMFKRSEDPEGFWEWVEDRGRSVWSWEIKTDVLHNVDMGNYRMDLPEGVAIEVGIGKFFPIFFDVEWDGLRKPRGPWTHGGAIIDAGPDFPMDVPLTDEKFREGLKLLVFLERAVAKVIDEMEDKLGDTFARIEDDIRSFGRDDSY